jgi:site-specific DNA-methyltransferase (adenine-specific)
VHPLSGSIDAQPADEASFGTIRVGDCVQVMRSWPEACVDAIVTDPPYGLQFMGVAWDTFSDRPTGTAQMRSESGDFGTREHRRNATEQAAISTPNRAQHGFHTRWAREAYRVLKPGGHLLAFGGTRTYHRLACALEDAGFDIRDTLCWLYGSGLPKSLDVSRAIDRAAGVEREVIRLRPSNRPNVAGQSPSGSMGGGNSTEGVETARATEDAARWHGWGTALKPAHELIVLARKPLTEPNVAANVLWHCTGAINVDACRIRSGEGGNRGREAAADRRYAEQGSTDFADLPSPRGGSANGRWPANVVLSHAPECTEVGKRTVHSSEGVIKRASARRGHRPNHIYGAESHTEDMPMIGYGTETIPAWECSPDCPVRILDEQSGTMSTTRRRRERSEGALVAGTVWGTDNHRSTGYPGDTGSASRFFYCAKASRKERSLGLHGRNPHPTVKPIAVMEWLIRLITPPGGVVLDPFLGTGTTAIAAQRCGVGWVGIEREHEYVALAQKRIKTA